MDNFGFMHIGLHIKLEPLRLKSIQTNIRLIKRLKQVYGRYSNGRSIVDMRDSDFSKQLIVE